MISYSKWIENRFQGKLVKEVGGEHSRNRTGRVIETMWDENGALHCRMIDDADQLGWWCPAKWLEVI